MKSFDEWKRTLNNICFRRLGIEFDDLPDLWMERDIYEEGISPTDFFNQDVLPGLESDGWPVEGL